MKRKMRTFLSILTVFAILFSLLSVNVQAAKTINSNGTGIDGGFYYSFWSNGGGSVNMTLGDKGNYNVKWNNCGDFTCGKGWSKGSGHTISYKADSYQNSGGGSLAVYGWTKNPLVEYYICEEQSGVTSNPGTQKLGTYTSDDGTYTIYKHQQVNQPSIEGNSSTFWQYISVRNTPRKSGTITVQNHFDAWKKAGMNLGTQDYQIMLTESWNGSGQSDVTVWEGGTSDPGGDPVNTDTNAFSTIEAENYSSVNSSTAKSIGNGMGYIENGDSLAFKNVDFGSGAASFTATVANGNDTSTNIEIREGSESGTLLGTLEVPGTGDWDTYKDMSCNISKVTGKKDLYLKFSGPVNIDAFKFSKDSVTPIDPPEPGDLKGDVNGDGNVDVFDATLVKAVVLKKKDKSSLKNPENADMDGKDGITALDYLLIKKKIHGVDPTPTKKFLGNVIASSIPSNFSDYWDQSTPENASKWGSVEYSQGNRNWDNVDLIYNYCKDKKFPFKYHTLVWGSQAPNWIDSLSTDKQTEAIKDWIQAAGKRYPKADFVDVVNEPLHTPISFKNAMGGDGTTGWDWVVWSFEQARKAFPNSKLLINEYGIINDPNCASNYIKIINILKSKGLVDGIGIQCHCFNIDDVSVSTMKTVLSKLKETGLPIYVSELDITGDDNTQLARYKEKFPVLWEEPAIKGVTLWGWIEGTTWKDGTYLFTKSGAERPALKWLKEYVGKTTSDNKDPDPNPNPNPNAKLVALTFDDGPDTQLTPLVLDKLDKYKVPATFMMIGQKVNSSTEPVIKRIINSGCEIGNHSWAYDSMNNMSADQIKKSIADTNAAILKYSGTTPKFFRAPNLSMSNTMLSAIDLTFIQGVIGHDWEQSVNAQQRANNILNGAQDGAIFLLHDVQPLPHPTPEALDIIIPTLQKQGYEFVTLSELFKRKGVTLRPSDDKVYTNVP